MRLYSTNLMAEEVSFETALMAGLAPDKGLYMPKQFPLFSGDELTALKDEPYPEIAFMLLKRILHGELDEHKLRDIVYDAYGFDIPLEKVDDITCIMRLDQGPTSSFKDFAARMMARLMQYYLGKQDRKLTILTATSGDTGSAVAHAFFGMDNIDVIVLFPRTEVSDRQRKQMTTLGKNITALSIDGKFDDCQAMVKQAFVDPELKDMDLSSANSINIGRLIPQSIYYFYAYLKLRKHPDDIVFSIPSGNFGNMMGCVLAKTMGLPVRKIVAAVNENDEVPLFMGSGIYNKIEPSKNCLSNAMNVGHPSNLARLIAIYGGQMDEKGNILRSPDMKKLRQDIFSVSVTDAETKSTMREFYDRYGIMIEPHGAVGLKGLSEYRKATKDNTFAVSLETADPAKFPAEVRAVLGVEAKPPRHLMEIESRAEHMEHLSTEYTLFRDFLKAKLQKR